MRALLLPAVLAVTAPSAPTQDDPVLRPGAWRAVLASPGGELPFGLRFARRGSGHDAWVVNGTESIPVARVAVADGRVALSFEPYESSIDATLSADGARLSGTWRARRDAEQWSEMAFEAAHGERPRFALREVTARAALPARWAVRFSSSDDPAVLVADAGDDGVAQATFLTTLGDYRYLAGAWDGATLALSCFDGAHAFLFRATRLPDGTLAGDFWSKDTWHETFSATPDPAAALPDAFALTVAREDTVLSELEFPDLDGEPRSLADDAFGGRARVLFVFGTWCPNCRDATRLMAELDRRHRARGLSIVGLAFERTGDPAIDLPQLRRYVESQGVRFPVLLAGLADKQRASDALPLLDRVRAYPTTVFLDSAGRVTAVHTGFSGPATGAAHARLVARFEEILGELLR